MGFARKLLFAALVACSYAANEPGLVALTDYDCGCPGQNSSFICTAVGGVITVWEGSAFDCQDRNEISLRHSQFENAIGECNEGAIVGYGVESMNNCFTSRLDVRLSADLQGRTITCSVDDGSGPATGVTSLGTRMLIVSTPSAPSPAPERLTALVANNELIFRWDQLDPNDYNCSTLQYDFTSENCGSCAVVTPRVVSCTGFQTSTAGITCTFTVWSVVCGNVTGPGSMRSIDVILKVPDAPTVKALPRYQDGRVRILIGLKTTFATVESTFISDGIDGSIRNYTITYGSTLGSTCGTANIPASSCVGGMCTHSFDILQSSFCPPSTTIIVNVAASNVLGSSPQPTTVIKEGINNLVNVTFDRNQRSIICTFLNQPPNIVKQCSANITYGEDCDRFLGIFTGMGTGDNVTTQPLETVSGVIEYCFLVTAETNNVTALVDGTLLNIIDSQANLAVAIAVPLGLVFLAIIVLLIVVVVIAVKRFKVPKSTVQLTFSVEDKPGSLAKALKIFKDCEVNILGLNTHRHHAEFDRDAGNGYKYNYVHCICTKDDKEFLEKDLEAELEGDSQEYEIENITAVIKVKDSPGALWNAIDKIGNRGINILGVNTLSKRESIPGYKDNHVKCHCSEEKLRRVCTQLRMLTGKPANIEYLDEEHREERAIEYLVKDEVGALASTLEVISEMGINISGVNPDHLPDAVRDGRTTGSGFKINFVECSIDESTKERLSHRLKAQYGAVDVGKHDVSSDKVDEDPDHRIVKVTIHNEAGALNRILKGFRDLKINIRGVNALEPVFPREREIPYKHYHVEITATNDQEKNLKRKLLSEGLAIDIKPFDLSEYQEADQTNDIQNFLQGQHEAAETESTAESEMDVAPTTKVIQFLVKDEVGSLSNALQVFNELGVNITRVNPAHLPREHQDDFVECSCAQDQRESLISKLNSYGAKNAKEVKHVKFVDANYCIVKFSFVREDGSIDRVLKAFRDVGAKVLNFNPSYIKVHNQYVECCCTEDKQRKLLRRLSKVVGVMDAGIAKPENLVSNRPTEDSNYCIVKYSVDDKAGTLVRALKVFFNLNINIIGVNTLKPAFDRVIPVQYKHNHVLLVATEEEIEELKHQLLVTGLAFGVGPYTRVKRSDDSEALQPGTMDENDIALSTV